MRHVVFHLSFVLLPIWMAIGDCVAAGLGVTPADQFSTLDGFEVELVYDVPGETQGSWVSLTVDPQGRLIACDQYGGLYRIDVSGAKAKVEKLAIDFAGAQGLLCAFGSLYANVNARGTGAENPSGVWRLTDTDGDDQYDKKEHLLPLNGGSEHGPHAMILTPDGKRIVMCAGNNTNLPNTLARSRVPQNWAEDHLLGRMPDARGHNASRLGPGGFILSMNPDGSDIELVATGFRNEYDIAFNREGELFAYDADMEWDVGTPWYRPTRINHVISGAEFGWRNGTGKWPAYYPDSFGSAVDIGPGSPTGICFGYGAKFPKKYQNALFICDWSYGNIYAVHLAPDGSSYGGTYETFATAAPLPVTDIVIHPTEGSMYFTIGGRKTQSGLYRIRYTGKLDKDSDGVADTAVKQLRVLRHKLEATHTGEPSVGNIEMAIKNLAHADRAIRFAARISLEHQPVDRWRSRVVGLKDPQARILGVIALARNGNESDKAAALAALTSLKWDDLSAGERIDLLRAYGLIGIRLGKIDAAEAKPMLAQIGNRFPTGDHEVDRELAQMLVYLESADAIGKIVAEMKASPSQENQIHYAMVLRDAREGWNEKLHRQYFQWFSDIQSARGGMSFGGFIENIKKAALERLPKDLQQRLSDVINPPKSEQEVVAEPRPLVKEWKVDDLIESVTSSDHVPNFQRGKEVFAAGQCYKCHRMGIQGGILGPVLTAAGGRFSPKDLLVSIIEPDKEISDQYGATQFLTDDGRIVVGRIVNMNGTKLQVMTNMLDPSQLTVVERDTVETTRPARTSMMPAGLLDTFNQEEIADLIAYLRAGGREGHPIYNKSVAKNWSGYEGKPGPGNGKHVVFLAGDEEYRSEEGLPMLAKILSQRHGFKCTVLFSVDDAGVIDPGVQTSLAGAEALDSADAIVMLLRFRNWPDETMKHFVDAFERGVPIVALRTSTHAFQYPGDRTTKYRDYNNFGKQVLGERWVSHWGHHKKEATRGVIEPSADDDPILRGVEDLFADSDVYEAYPPADAKILVRGAVLQGMEPGDELASYTKKRRSDSAEQDVNKPMMPVSWSRLHKNEAGTENKIFCTTLGAATDLQSEGVRRMVVNAIYWGLKMDVPEKADVGYVDPFEPTMYGFNSFRRGIKPADHSVGKILPSGLSENR